MYRKSNKKICPETFEYTKYKEGQYIFKSNNSEYGSVIHLHGVSFCPEEMGITFQTVSRVFHPDLVNLIDSWIENDNKIIFLGYSCGDNYDVERYFGESKQSYTAIKSEAIYVQRRDKTITPPVKRHLEFFSKSYILTMALEKFLKKMLGDDSGHCAAPTSSFDWSTKVSNLIKVSDRMRGLLFFRICKLTGMNPAGFSFYNRANNAVEEMLTNDNAPVKENILRLTKLIIMKENGDAAGCLDLIESADDEYNTRFNNTIFYEKRSEYDKNEILVVMGKYEELKERLPQPSDIRQTLLEYKQVGERLGWGFSTPLNQHMAIIINEVRHCVSKNGVMEIPSNLKLYCKEVMKCNDEILLTKYSQLEEINQYCVSLRIKAMLLAVLFGEEQIDDVNKCVTSNVELYAKESSIQGLLMSLYQYAGILLILYFHTRKYEYKDHSMTLIKKLEKLQSEIGDKKIEMMIDDHKKWRNSIGLDL